MGRVFLIYTPKKIQENRKLWVEALRSNDYISCRADKAWIMDLDGGISPVGVAMDVTGLGQWVSSLIGGMGYKIKSSSENILGDFYGWHNSAEVVEKMMVVSDWFTWERLTFREIADRLEIKFKGDWAYGD